MAWKDYLPGVGSGLSEEDREVLDELRNQQSEAETIAEPEKEETDEQQNEIEALIENTSKLDAKKNSNKAKQKRQRWRQEAESHQQKVYEYIKKGSKAPESERIELALEAKSEQVDATFARLNAKKMLKNQIVWRFIRMVKEHRTREPQGSDIDVPIGELNGELGQLGTEMQDIWSTVQTELEEALTMMNSMGHVNGDIEIQSGEILQQMEEFDPDTTEPSDFANIGMSVSDNSTEVTEEPTEAEMESMGLSDTGLGGLTGGVTGDGSVDGSPGSTGDD